MGVGVTMAPRALPAGRKDFYMALLCNVGWIIHNYFVMYVQVKLPGRRLTMLVVGARR